MFARGPTTILIAMAALLGAIRCDLRQEDPVHLGIELRDCRDAEGFQLCIERLKAIDSPAYKLLDSTFRLAASGSLRIRGRDSAVTDYSLPMDIPGEGIGTYEFPDSLGLGSGGTLFHACIRDEVDYMACDTLTVVP